MKQTTLFAIIAFLLGVSFFGIHQSLILHRRGVRLDSEVGALRLRVGDYQAQLKEKAGLLEQVQRTLGERTFEKESLEGEVQVLQKQLAFREKALESEKERIAELSSELRQIAESRASLESEALALSGQHFRLILENREMRKKLSSIKDLKQAIRDLKKKPREKKRRKPASREERPRPKDVDLVGNQGFVIKDGEFTYATGVDIQVLPAQEGRMKVDEDKR